MSRLPLRETLRTSRIHPSWFLAHSRRGTWQRSIVPRRRDRPLSSISTPISYHPPLFVLHRIAGVRDRFHVLCDDWTGGTCEAVWSFARTSGFRIRFLGKVSSRVHGLPKKVSLELLRPPAKGCPRPSEPMIAYPAP